MSRVMWGFTLLLVVLSQTDPTTGLTPSQLTNLLNDHNTARRTLATPTAANMIELQWDPLLAQTAFNYLNSAGCNPFNHNANRDADYHALGGTNDNGQGVGENWYSGGPDAATDPATPTTGGELIGGGAVAAWTVNNCDAFSGSAGSFTCTDVVCSESESFYGQTNPSGGACPASLATVGHFTQVMWASTAFVGCGFTVACGTLCDYAPAGNSGDITQQANVWTAGTPATQCPAGFPVPDSGLCAAVGSTPAPGGSTPAPGGSTPAPGGSTPAPGGSTPAPTTPTTTGPSTPQPSTTPTSTTRGNLPPPPPGRVIFPKPKATPKQPAPVNKAAKKKNEQKKKKKNTAKNVAGKKTGSGGNIPPTNPSRPIFPGKNHA